MTKAMRTTNRQQINIVSPEETIQLIDRVSKKRFRGRLVSEAVNYYVEKENKTNLRRRLKEGATRRAERDLNLAKEWFAFEEDA